MFILFILYFLYFFFIIKGYHSLQNECEHGHVKLAQLLLDLGFRPNFVSTCYAALFICFYKYIYILYIFI